MDYLKLIRSFWSQHSRDFFTGNETLFYWRLVELFNEEGEKDVWPEELRFGDSALCSATGLSLSTLKGDKRYEGVRKSLINRGLIEFEPTGKGFRSGGLYRLVLPTSSPKRSPKRSPKFGEVTGDLDQEDSQKDSQRVRQKDRQNSANSYIYITKPTKQPNLQTLNKILYVAHRDEVQVWMCWLWLIENKKKPPRLPPAPPKPESPPVGLPFGEAFAETWALWISYRNERRLSAYKPIGLKAALNDLVKLSGNDETNAIKLIHHAIAKNWQGIFPIRDNGNATNQRNGNQLNGSRTNQAAEPYAFDLARALANNATNNGDEDPRSDEYAAFEYVE